VPADAPTVVTLVLPPDLIPRLPAAWEARLLVLTRQPDGQYAADGFPDEIDVAAGVVGLLDPAVVRLERGRLYVTAANGQAVYVPVGPSRIRGCTRYGRLYLRRAE
jgi:hypothetical protein